MAEINKLKQHYLDSIERVEEFIEDHVVKEFDHMDDSGQCLQEFNIIAEKFKGYQSELKVALGEGFEGIYEDREAFTAKLRNYLRDLSAKIRELKKLYRQKATADLEKANKAAEQEKQAVEKQNRDHALVLEDKRLAAQLEEKKALEELRLKADAILEEKRLAAQMEERKLKQSAEAEIATAQLEGQKLQQAAHAELEEKKFKLE